MGSYCKILLAVRCVIAVGIMTLVTACAGGVQPFSKSNAPGGKTPPAITVTAMNGLPADKAQVLFDNLAVAAGKRDIAIVRGAFQGGYFMVGEFQALPSGATTQVTYRWSVYNAQKQVIHTIANVDNGRIGGADPWSGVDPDLLRRIAGFTAESLATRLHTLGYATRLSGLPPPGQLKLAGPNAHRDIDYETVYGPGAVAPPVIASLQPQAPLTTPPAGVHTASLPGKKPPLAKTARAVTTGKQPAGLVKKPARSGNQISAVAMTRVSGSPGNGNRDLLLAMRKVMKGAGWPVLTRERRDALTVTGKVKLGAVKGARQKVAVAWTVSTPDGKVLGTIRQANNVPAGSLNRGWGKSATYVSQAAAEGIFKLVKSVQ